MRKKSISNIKTGRANEDLKKKLHWVESTLSGDFGMRGKTEGGGRMKILKQQFVVWRRVPNV